MRALLVGGDDRGRGLIERKLESVGVEVTSWWSNRRYGHDVSNVDCIIVVYSITGHGPSDAAKKLARHRNIPLASIHHQWSRALPALKQQLPGLPGHPVIIQDKRPPTFQFGSVDVALARAAPPLIRKNGTSEAVPVAVQPVQPDIPIEPAQPVQEATVAKPVTPPKEAPKQQTVQQKRTDKLDYLREILKESPSMGYPAAKTYLQNKFHEAVDFYVFSRVRDEVRTTKGMEPMAGTGRGRELQLVTRQPTIKGPLPDDIMAALQMLKEYLPESGIKKLTLTVDGDNVKVGFERVQVQTGEVDL